MIDNERLLSASMIHEGGLNSRDINELKDRGIISELTDITDLPYIYKDIEISPRLRDKLSDIEKTMPLLRSKAESYGDMCLRYGIDIVTDKDDDYPYYWRKLSGMPSLVFIKGKRDILGELQNGSCAVVGSRSASRYALAATNDIVGTLVQKDITIISGMALGIDRQAHLTALNNGGKTIAFLAGSPENIYPWGNKDIYEAMADRGLIVSEMPPGTKAQKQFFPSRNRLISGLCDVCLIMEAGIQSGTLHTASFAALQGKEVYVLPNTIYSEEALGGLMLIRDGANIIINAEDIVMNIAERCFGRLTDPKADSVDLFSRAKTDPDSITDDELKEMIIEELKVKARSADSIVATLNQSYGRVSQVLSDLEIEGKVAVDRGKFALTIFKH